ncbi:MULTISPECIES: hypothetical protein [Methylobacter]|uniref:hypothetical protein n=1 Tax=Methylobacter TaxID=429 RepID=UPI0003625564|nr:MULTISPECIES: hypothetical protein [Methylobacter]
MKYASVLLVVFFSLAACGPPTVQEVRYTRDTFEPTANVEVLDTWPRDRKYRQIAELEVSAGDHANDALVEKAREMGADAIVIGPAFQHSQVHVPIDSAINGASRSYRAVPLNRVRGIAIKFEP